MKAKKRKSEKVKKPWPTKDAMIQVYEKGLWGTHTSGFYSGLGSHHPNAVDPYIETVIGFLDTLESPLTVCDLGCGDFNVGKHLVEHADRYISIDIVPELIKRNSIGFQDDCTEFHCLDITVDDLPSGDCALVRQVLQHISNAEVKSVVKKLYNYKYVILTEHIPEGDFEPNKDIISGQGTRLKKGSGIDLLAPPFNFKVKDQRQLLSTELDEFEGVIVTTLYTVY